MVVRLFLLFLIPSIFVALKMAEQEPVTAEFEKNAPAFYVYGKKASGYDVLTLKQVRESNGEYDFLLDADEIENREYSYPGVDIEEISSNEQVITYYYDGTYISKSTYRVVNDRVEPLRYHVTASFLHGVYGLVAIIAAFILAVIYSIVHLVCSALIKKVLSDTW